MGLFNKNKKEKDNQLVIKENNGIIIQENELSIIENDFELIEIEDHQVINQINQALPGLARTTNNVAKVAKGANTLYTCDIPLDKLTTAKDGNGLRAIAREGGKIEKNARLKVFKKNVNIQNISSAAFNAASVVVGMHYMSEISNKLNLISDEIKDVKEFQINEYKSQAITLMNDILFLVNNQKEVLTNDQLRNQELLNLNNYEHECERLINQATGAINSFTKKEYKDFKEYSNKVQEINYWYSYQNALYRALNEITNLKYTLNLGNVSLDYCKNRMNNYLLTINESSKRLYDWHYNEIKLLNIDSENLEYKKNKWFNKAFSIGAKLIKVKDKINYAKIDESLIKIINNQMSNNKLTLEKPRNIFEENVKIIAKDNKYYYGVLKKEKEV